MPSSSLRAPSRLSRHPAALLGTGLLSLTQTPSLLAHTDGSTGGFVSGFSHPWSGLDHVVAMIAVGLWGAQLGKPAIWLLPVTFPLVMAIGGFLGLIGVHLPAVELGIGASALVLGIMVAARITPKNLVWPAVLVGVFGLFHGHAHGTELPPGDSGLVYSIGFVLATGVLHGVGIALGEFNRKPAGAKAVRTAGALIAAGGAWFCVRALS